MSLIEVLLRLGCSLVGWMVIYTHCIWTATLAVVGCDPDGDHLWRLLFGFTPLVLGFCFLLNTTHKIPEVHRILIWLSAPLILLVPLAIRGILPTLAGSTVDGGPICAGFLRRTPGQQPAEQGRIDPVLIAGVTRRR